MSNNLVWIQTLKKSKNWMNNNNEKLNESRETVNKSVNRYTFMGAGLSRVWNSKRRYRTI